MKKAFLVSFLGICLLTGCAGFQKDPGYKLAPHQTIDLPSVNCTSDFDREELVTYEHLNRRAHFIADLSCRNNTIEMKGVMPSGTTLFVLDRRGDAISYKQKADLPEGLVPAQILGAYLLATLPHETLASHFPSYQIISKKTERQILTSNGNVLFKASLSNGHPITIRNNSLNYTVRLKTLKRQKIKR